MCTDFCKLTPLQREIYDPILQIERQEKTDPQNNDTDNLECLKNFSSDTCALNTD